MTWKIRQPNMTAGDIDNISKLAALGHTRREVADLLNLNYRVVQQRALRYGVVFKQDKSGFDWTPERKELLRQYADKGATALFLAGQLGATRNAVLGQAHRMGVRFKGQLIRPVNVPKRPSRKPRVRVMPPANSNDLLEQTLAEITYNVDTLHVMEEVMALKPEHCRWPCGDLGSEHFQFCKNMKAGVKVPYCSEHLARAWRDGGYAETGSSVVSA